MRPAWSSLVADRQQAGRDWRRDAVFAAGTCAGLAAWNNLLGARAGHRRRYLPANAAATALALAAAAGSGLRAGELGLSRDRLTAGVRLGAGAGGAAAAGWLAVAAVPAARPVLRDRRVAGLRGRELACMALVRIPVGTVLWEEVAFRGLAQAALARVLPGPAALAATAGLFGAWHIRPAAEALAANQLARGPAATAAAVAAACTGLAGAGAVLSWLRVRSGSLAAPALVHLAVSSGAVLAARAVAGRV